MSTDVAQTPEPEDKSINLATVPDNVKQMVARINLTASFETTSTQINIMDRILAAQSPEELFEVMNAGTESGQSFVGQPFLLRQSGIEWKRSAPGYVREGAFPFYALLNVVGLSDGREHILDCGGFSFVAALDRLETLGVFDAYEPYGLPLVLTSKTMKGSGFDVLLLAPYNGPLLRREAV